MTVYDLKDKMKGMLECNPNQDSVTVFLAEVPKETILSSDSECKMVDLEKVSNKMNCLLIAVGQVFIIIAESSLSTHMHSGTSLLQTLERRTLVY